MYVTFKQMNKSYIVMFNETKMKNPQRVEMSFPIPAEISSYMQLQNFLPDLNKMIDERSRVQAVIVS